MSLGVYDLPFEGIEVTLIQWVAEALELRHGESGDSEGKIELPAYELGHEGVLDVIRRTRIRLDRVEELQAKARQAKGRITRARASAELEAKIAYDTAMQQNAAKRTQTFVTGAERNADATLDSLQLKRQAHQLSRMESVADESFDVIKGCYWGLDKIRSELLSMLQVQENLRAIETLT